MNSQYISNTPFIFGPGDNQGHLRSREVESRPYILHFSMKNLVVSREDSDSEAWVS